MGLAKTIQNDEKQGPTRADKVLPRQGKTKGVHYHQAILHEMLKGLI